MASGDSLAEWTAQGAETPASNYGTFAVVNNQPVLEFDAATDETAYFSGVLPNHYGGGGITATLVWTSATATSGNCVWTGAFERQAVAHPIGTDSFASAQSVTDASPGTAGNLEYVNIPFTAGAQMDSLAVNERFRFAVARDADNGSDTMAGDARLIAVFLRET